MACQAALVLARKLTDPPVLIEALSAHLEIDRSDALRAEATGVIERVGGRLSESGAEETFPGFRFGAGGYQIIFE